MPGCYWTTVWLTAGACGVLLSVGAADDGDAGGNTADVDGAIDDETALAEDPSADKVPATGVDVHPVSPKAVSTATANNAGRASMLATPFALDP